MTLFIRCPSNLEIERKYIVDVIINSFLGLDYRIKFEKRHEVLITVLGDENNKELFIEDTFFNIHKDIWLKTESLPQQPLVIWDLKNSMFDSNVIKTSIPVIYGKKLETTYESSFVQESFNIIRLGLDIFGSAFFMLTRYEELVKPIRDHHDRFPGISSLAYQEGFLNRPIINEYVEVLWLSLLRLWPGLERKKRQFRIILSHDVDSPYEYAFKPLDWALRAAVGDLAKRHSISLAAERLFKWHRIKNGFINEDPYNQFDLIMDISEKHGLRSSFYFFAQCSPGLYEGDYDFNHPLIKNIVKKIHDRHHNIGLHGSYTTYQNPDKLHNETEYLKEICNKNKIHQELWGGRQHYLRWDVRHTWFNYYKAGLAYDTTLSYADFVGFRCGVCYEYPVFDLLERRRLPLYEKPLIIMDGSLLDSCYMNLDPDLAVQTMLDLKKNCKTVEGDYSILWHNTYFVNNDYRRILECVLS